MKKYILVALCAITPTISFPGFESFKKIWCCLCFFKKDGAPRIKRSDLEEPIEMSDNVVQGSTKKIPSRWSPEQAEPTSFPERSYSVDSLVTQSPDTQEAMVLFMHAAVDDSSDEEELQKALTNAQELTSRPLRSPSRQDSEWSVVNAPGVACQQDQAPQRTDSTWSLL